MIKFGAIDATTSKFIGGTLAPNGFIYCFPTDTYASIMRINPYKRTVDFVPKTNISDDCGGSVLANNGNIYTMPNSTSFGIVMEYDPTKETYTTFGNAEGSQYFGGALATNGMIYCAPYINTDDVLMINPYTKKLQRLRPAPHTTSL